jgi:hypothetical protein
MKQKTFLTGFWLICCCLLLASCTPKQDFTSEQMDFSAVRTVAVLPLQNLTSDDQASERVRDAFMVVLLATEGIYVLPPGEVARGINRVGIRTPATPTVEEIIKLQGVIGVDAVITGVLREYGSVRSGSAEANLVSLSLQMVETQTGIIVWSGASTRGGITMTDRLLGSGGQPMNDVTIQVLNDLLNQLFE